MKSVVKPLSIITTIIFVVGIIVTAIYLYSLPDQLISNSSVLDLNNIKEIQPALSQGVLIMGLVLASGLAALVLQVMLGANSSKGNVVYVEKFISDNNSSAHGTENNRENGEGSSSYSNEIIQKIKETTADLKEPDQSLELALRTLCTKLEASQGAVYVAKENGQSRFLEIRASFAYMKPDSQTLRFEFGEGLPGQVAKEGILLNIDAVPEGYIKILSGLGQATPKHLLLVPVKDKNKIVGVVEIASFTPFTTQDQELCSQAFTLLTKQFARSSEKINVSEEEAFEGFEEKAK